MKGEHLHHCHYCGHHFEPHLGRPRDAEGDCPNCQADRTVLDTMLDLLADLPRARTRQPAI